MTTKTKFINLKVGFEVAVILLLLTSLTTVGGQGSRTTTSVHWLSNLAEVEGGSATLVRSGEGVSYNLRTSGLTSRDAVTNWWVIFNHPSACTNPINEIGSLCGLDDLFGVGVDASVLFATGHVVGNGNHANFAAHLLVGDTDGALFGPGLTNPEGAEVHIIVRTHGEMIPELVAGQISSVDVACDINVCEDLQAAAFVP